MRPRWAPKPRRTDRLVVGRNVTLTLTRELVDGQWKPVREEESGLQEVLDPEE
jgi:hypothetical protein